MDTDLQAQAIRPSQAAPFDHAAASREGWDVFDCGPDFDGRLQQQRNDAPEAGKPATPGSTSLPVPAPGPRCTALHRAALAAIDDTKRMLIEATCGAW